MTRWTSVDTGDRGRLVHVDLYAEILPHDLLHVIAVVDEGESLVISGHRAQFGASGRAQHVQQTIDFPAVLFDFLNRDQIEMP